MEKLDISYCPRISDEGLGAVLKSSPGLIELNVSWCRKHAKCCRIIGPRPSNAKIAYQAKNDEKAFAFTVKA